MSATVDVGRFSYQDEPSANPQPVCRRSGCGAPALDDGEWCANCQAVVDAVRAEKEASIERWRQHDLSMRKRRGPRLPRGARTTDSRIGADIQRPGQRANVPRPGQSSSTEDQQHG